MGVEQKFQLATPPMIAQSPNMTEAYCARIVEALGIKKVEIINNEVISAGKNVANPSQVILVHCRVTGATLDFTARSS